MPRSPVADQEIREPRSRSASPVRGRHHKPPNHYAHRPRSRSRSPRRHEEKHRRRRRYRSPSPPQPVLLPYNAKQLSKRHFENYKPLFQSYLDIQKQIALDELDEREAKGRWKSFVGRWNHGDLARSWYDPSMLKSAQETVRSFHKQSPAHNRRASPQHGIRREEAVEAESEDDDFGPAPPSAGASRQKGYGPTIPRFDDIALRNEQRADDIARTKSDHVDDVRFERTQDRRTQKERLEELAPRADPGSRERQLEKKRETTGTLNAFRDAKEGGDVELGEADLMGDDGIEGHKKRKNDMDRQKNEREIRREEIMRARAAEREERLAGRREKEAETMAYLKAIAKERFG